jgi:hypothetical protein
MGGLTSLSTFARLCWLRYFRTVPCFIQGETMQNDNGKVSRSMPIRGNMYSCCKVRQTSASRQNCCKLMA